MVVKLYISGISGNKEVKKKQQRVQMILDSKNINYEAIDITEPGKEKDKAFMQQYGRVRETLGKYPLPPQIFNDDDFCGDYEDFDLANEIDELEKFLHIETNSKSVENGSKQRYENITRNTENTFYTYEEAYLKPFKFSGFFSKFKNKKKRLFVYYYIFFSKYVIYHSCRALKISSYSYFLSRKKICRISMAKKDPRIEEVKLLMEILETPPTTADDVRILTDFDRNLLKAVSEKPKYVVQPTPPYWYHTYTIKLKDVNGTREAVIDSGKPEGVNEPSEDFEKEVNGVVEESGEATESPSDTNKDEVNPEKVAEDAEAPPVEEVKDDKTNEEDLVKDNDNNGSPQIEETEKQEE